MKRELNNGAIEPGTVLYLDAAPPLRVAKVYKHYDDGSDAIDVGFGTDLRWFIDDTMTGVKVFNGPDDLAAHLWSEGQPGQWGLEALHALGWLGPDPRALAAARDAAEQSTREWRKVSSARTPPARRRTRIHRQRQ